MVEVFYLAPGLRLEDLGGDEPWVAVEACNDGRFFGTGCARKSSGEAVFYASLPESDVSLVRALDAAKAWAAKYGVARIIVQAEPD